MNDTQQKKIEQLLKKAADDYQQQAYHQAAKYCNHILRINQTCHSAYDILGAIAYHTNQGKMACYYFQQACQLQPNNGIYHLHLGMALQLIDQNHQASISYQHAITLSPQHGEVYFHYGTLLQKLAKYHNAAQQYITALQYQPKLHQAQNNLGDCFLNQGNFSQAEYAYINARKLDPQSKLYQHNLAECYRFMGKYQQAKKIVTDILATDEYHPQSLDLLAKVESQLQHYRSAHLVFNKLLAAYPNNAYYHYHFSLSLLAQGKFAQGWQEFEWRLKLPQLRYLIQPLAKPRYQGDSLQDKIILLYTEQGFGDSLQFLRYIEYLNAKNIIVQTHQSLKLLLQDIPKITAVYDFTECLPHYDVQAPLLSLPFLLKLHHQPLMQKSPYLFASDNLIQKWQSVIKNPQQFTIGIAWSSNNQQRKDKFVFSCLTDFLPLANIPGVQLYALQKDHDIVEDIDNHTIVNLGNRIKNFADTAAIVSQLDLVITIDTALAHLAGALGQPVWILLTTSADWRWMKNNQPLYQSARLFRQKQRGDWCSVFETITAELLKVVTKK